MNGTFFKNPYFSEENELRNDYNLLKDNVGKKVKIHSAIISEENQKVFSGILEHYKEDSLILSDPSNGNWYFIPIKYVYYIEFEERMII